MKIKKDQVNLITSEDSNTDSINFGIGDTGVIIDLLRKRLYSHPLRTMVQEYLSNGRDANREAQNNKSICVTLPTKLDPVFKVRDFGPGLSPERVRTVFVLYGSSTKRKDNNQTGGFGIGAKSAWAYTDSFTITSVHDGVKSTYIAHLGKKSEGSLDLLETESTNEETGVEVSISIQEKDIADVHNAVYRTTKFWDKKPQFKGIVDVEIPREYKDGFSLKGEGYAIGNRLLPWHSIENSKTGAAKNSKKGKASQSNFWAVVDGIPYEITKAATDDHLSTLGKGQYYLFFKTGEVQINANREELVFDESVIESLKKRIDTMVGDLKALIQKDVEKAKNLKEMRSLIQKDDSPLKLLQSRLVLNLKLANSSFKIIKEKTDVYDNFGASLSFPDDTMYDSSFKLLDNFLSTEFKHVIFLKDDNTYDKNKWLQFIRNYDYSMTGHRMLHDTLDQLVFVKTTNKAPYEGLELPQDKQDKIRQYYEDYFKKEIEREAKRKQEAEARKKATAERESWRDKWGKILEIGYSYNGLHANTAIITFDLEEHLKVKDSKTKKGSSPNDWFYVVVENVYTGKMILSKEELKTIYFAQHEKKKRTIATDKVRAEKLKQLGMKSLEEIKEEIKSVMVIPDQLKTQLREVLRTAKVPSFVKYLDEEYLKEAGDSFTTEDAETIRVFRTTMENKPYVDLNYIKNFYPEEFKAATITAKEEKERVQVICQKFGFFTCINFKANTWRTETLRFLKLVKLEQESKKDEPKEAKKKKKKAAV